MRRPIYALFVGMSLTLTACSSKREGSGTAELWLTTTDQKSLLEKKNIDRSAEKAPDATITIDPDKTYQDMDGFGYTLTGGSALHIHNMSDAARTDLLQELFGTEKGNIGVSYLRVSIGASDLDENTWSYSDLPEGKTDEKLKGFSLAYDTLHLIPVLKEVLQIAPDIKILGSPWSPPVWMKDNKDTRGGSLLPEYYDSYARYFVKYIEAMRSHGIRIDAITIQNEPLHPGNNPSLLMLPEQQAEFIRDHLGPAFEQAGIDTKIILYDHNADRPDYPISILDDPETAKYVDGSAFHLYGGEIGALSEVHRAHPDKHLYFTEQWVGAPGDFEQEMTWHTENLIIGASRNWCRTVLEWNLAADENLDPHTDRGGCDRCLGAVTITGDKVTREPAYYIIAQASRFVRPGSVRIGSNMPAHVPNVAFKTPDGQYICIIQNTGEREQHIAIKLKEETIPVKLGAGAVGTLVVDIPGNSE